MAKSNLRLAKVSDANQLEKEAQFAEYIARVMEHPKTPRTARDVIFAILITDLSNNSGYGWEEDPEGLRFMLPRLLSHLNRLYSDGLTDATFSAIQELLPIKTIKTRTSVDRLKNFR